jgi:myo-inositol-1(or 4)-monophosphatase
MSDADLDLRLLVACATVHEAGKLARHYFEHRAELEFELMGIQDLVSVADRAVEEVIRARLGACFPKDGIIGEEGKPVDAAPGAGLWVIDPIDGTANFLRGVPYWSVALAYVVDRRTELAVTYDPVHDELFAARRGGGTHRNGQRVHVSGRSDPKHAVLGASFTFKMSIPGYLALMEGILGAGSDHRRLGSTALMMCHVADGRLDGCATLYCNSWDIIGGLLLVQEAGGVASDFLDGAELTDPNQAFAATSGLADHVAGLMALAAE